MQIPKAGKYGFSVVTAKWMNRKPRARSVWASRETLDNLIMVINCNCNGWTDLSVAMARSFRNWKRFRGSGWNVIKVIWGSDWDELLSRDKDNILKKVMMETVDGEYQTYKAKDGAYVRQHFFGKDPRLLKNGRKHVG